MDAKINALKPGQEIEISRCNGIWCVASRSFCGRLLKFTRYTNRGFVVFKQGLF